MNHQTAHERFDKLLNVGCGAHFHSRWTNLDLVSDHPAVQAHDIRSGLPFANDHFDAVYHSHLLEHLTPQQGRQLLRDCYRVLRPGGVLRIVVPDLECIARLYLEMLRKAWMGDAKAAADYQWMKLEMLDQLVRQNSGGLMGQYMMNPEIINLDFVKSRIGKEYECCADAQLGRQPHKASWPSKFRRWFELTRRQVALRCVHLLLGKDSRDALAEGLFRQQGEVHRWMYDRYSLMQLCREVGFGQFRICQAHESLIDGFVKYQLDQCDEEIRKPDSLFVEARKASAALRKVA